MFSSKIKVLRFIAGLNVFAFSGAQVLMVALYPVLAEALHIPLSTLIACFSLGSFLFVAGSPYWSHKSNLWGRQRVLSIGTVALFISFGLVAFLIHCPFPQSAINLSILTVSRFIYGLIASAIVPVAQSLQADIADEGHSTKAMMIHSMSLSLGRVVGVALIVQFHETFKNILFVYLVIIAFASFLNFISRTTTFAQLEHLSPVSSWKMEFFSIKWIIGIAFVFTCFMESLNSSLAGTIKNLFELNSLSSSIITAKILLAASLGIFLIQVLGRAFAKVSWKAGMTVGILALVMGSALLSQIKSLSGLWLAMGFFIIGIGIIPPFYLSVLRAGGSSSQYGKRAGIIGSAHTLGYAVGGGISALVFKLGGQIGFVLFLIALSLGLVCLMQSQVMARSPSQGGT